MEAPIDLTIIIVSYNVRYYLDQCIQAVQAAAEGLEVEIIVVDNHSSDDSVEFLREHYRDQIILIANTDNPGFSKANNQGLAIAQGRYNLLLNPDTIVGEDTLSTCVAFMDAHPQAGALGVKMIDGTGTFLPESKRSLPTPWVSFYKIFGLSSLFPNNKTFGKYHLSFLSKDENHPIEILSGAFMFMRREALEKAGFLDEDFFMYGEDIDLSYRILLAGYQNHYLSDTTIIHYKGESTKKGSLNYVRVFYQAMIIFAQKHFSGRYRQGFNLAIQIAVYARAFLAGAKRIIDRVGLPVLEGGLIYAVMFGIKEYWEHYVKYIDFNNGEYPAQFVWGYMPAYTLGFVFFLWLTGAYRRPYRLRSLILAPFWSFLTIATATYLFPFILNFSRAIVGLSAVFTFFLAIGTRGWLNYRQKGSFFFTENPKTTVLLVGKDPQDLRRLQELTFQLLPHSAEMIGGVLVTPSGASEKFSIPLLGQWPQLAQLASVYQPDEIVLSGHGLTHTQIISFMEQTGPAAWNYVINPASTDYLIGPQLVYDLGHPLIPPNYALNNPFRRRQKRTLELFLCAGLIMTAPLVLLRAKHPGSLWKAWFSVLLGRAHWVGYAQKSPLDLPVLKPSYFSLRNRTSTPFSSLSGQEEIDKYYAKTYTWLLDLEIFFRNWWKLGPLNSTN